MHDRSRLSEEKEDQDFALRRAEMSDHDALVCVSSEEIADLRLCFGRSRENCQIRWKTKIELRERASKRTVGP